MNGPTRLGTIVVLNGTSSSGKSSIAQALQAAADRPWYWVGTDHFWAMMPREFEPADELPLRVGIGHAFVDTLLVLSRAGWDVVADAVVIHPAFRELVASRLAAAPAHFVAVRCDLAELERREAARGDRPVGQARSQHDRVHAGIAYDFEVDTSTARPDECARRILGYLREAGPPTGFRRLRDALAH